tara:strand:+ start:3466 stop:3897 length:432 start_codon:yes stop_codon:yes gene_type:complete
VLKASVTDRLSFLIIGLFYLATMLIGYYFMSNEGDNRKINQKNQKMLVHLVLIKFKEETSIEDLQKITDGAYSLQAINGVEDLNYGENVSPEGLGKGYSHSLTMKFAKATDRDSIYLPHPIHKKFVKLFVPNTESVLVYDFWE